MLKFWQNKKAFTLSEMVVVLIIFSILSVTLAGVFAQFLNGEKVAFAKQKISADMRYTLELMTREIRMNTIDYRVSGYYSGTVPVPTSELALLDANDNQIIFALSGSNCDTTNGCYIYLHRNGTNYRITPEDISVSDLKFYVLPTQDPFTLQSGGTFLADSQPRVIIYLRERLTGNSASEKSIQTAVSSKMYKR